MPKNRKNVKELTAHVVSTLSAKEDLPDFIKETIQALVEAAENHLEVERVLDQINIDLENADSKFKEALASANSHIKKSYYGLKGDDDSSKVKEYFGKLSPSKVDGKAKETKALLKDLLQVIANDTHNDLNNYESKFRASLDSLRATKDNLSTLKTDKKLSDNDEDKAYFDWETIYGKLKYYVRGFFYRSGVDYRIFFLDLGVSTPKPKVSSTDGEEESEKVEEVDDKPEVVE